MNPTKVLNTLEGCQRRYSILKYPWHTAHDYELSKLPHQFFYLLGTVFKWDTSSRPMPKSIKWISGEGNHTTDLMILHVDQWIFESPHRRAMFDYYNKNYKGLKVVINHGCNMLDGCSSEEMKHLLNGTYMVCNSSTAHSLWNIDNSRFIRHGMSIEEWNQTDYANHEVIIVQHQSRRASKYRNLELCERISKRLKVKWVGRDVKFSSFERYRSFLSSNSIFFNSSFASPNPRARTEAMLSGLSIVTTDSHGESEYIENGVNGFCSNNEDELEDYLHYLKDNPDKTREIGRAGRATAQKLFNINSFVESWNTLLNELLYRSEKGL